jgi:uncharacterized protein
MRRKLAVTGIAAAAVLAWAAPAFAHVTVSPDEAPAGSFTTLTFQVPNEEADATTTKVEVTFPSDPAIADASVQPVAGWTIDVKKARLETPVTTDEGDTLDERVDTITWTANGDAAIQEGQFQQFRVSAQLPDEGDAVEFPAVQTYSNGDEVRWVDPTGPDAPEAEHPAPTVALTAGGDEHGGGETPTTVASVRADRAGRRRHRQDDRHRRDHLLGRRADRRGHRAVHAQQAGRELSGTAPRGLPAIITGWSMMRTWSS